MAERTESGEPTEPRAVASYIAEMSSDLARLARGHGLTPLGYLLDMARLEAENLARPAERD